jgi:hypothetical protein
VVNFCRFGLYGVTETKIIVIGAVEMIGMNEALMLAKREDILDEIALALEAFTDDILPAVGESTFTIEPSIPDETSNKLVLTWEWKRLQKRISKEFTLNVVSTKEDFINEVKAYLFDLIISIVNL